MHRRTAPHRARRSFHRIDRHGLFRKLGFSRRHDGSRPPRQKRRPADRGIVEGFEITRPARGHARGLDHRMPAQKQTAPPTTTVSSTGAEFKKSIQPMLKEYCLKCHSEEKHKGDLNLEQFSSIGEVKKHPKIWQTVVEQISNNEMPPKEKPQPAPAQREQLLTWANAVLDEVALARAGDPGPVVLRRLS